MSRGAWVGKDFHAVIPGLTRNPQAGGVDAGSRPGMTEGVDSVFTAHGPGQAPAGIHKNAPRQLVTS